MHTITVAHLQTYQDCVGVVFTSIHWRVVGGGRSCVCVGGGGGGGAGLLNVRDVVTLRVAIMSQYFYFATVVVEHTRNDKQ